MRVKLLFLDYHRSYFVMWEANFDDESFTDVSTIVFCYLPPYFRLSGTFPHIFVIHPINMSGLSIPVTPESRDTVCPPSISESAPEHDF